MSDSLSTLNPTPIGPHPSVDTWVDYYAKRVPGKEAEGLRRHLARCRQCLDLVLDLDGFAEAAPPPADADASFEKAAVWRTVKSAVASRASMRARQWPKVAAVAASLAFGAVGVSAWIEQQGQLDQLRSQVAAFSKVQANAVILNLRPSMRVRSAGTSAASVELGDEPKMVVLVLNLAEEPEFSDYRVGVFDASNTEIARIPEVEISEIGNFQLALMSDLFRAGDYQLRLFGLEGESEQQLELFSINFR